MSLALGVSMAQQISLTLLQGEHGTVEASPDTGPYEVGSIVRLTATPKPGYELTAWTVEEVVDEGPTAVVFDNLDHSPDDAVFPGGPDYGSAQQFLMDNNSIVSEVQVKLQRWGTVEGNISFEIWSDNGEDHPGEKLGVIGLIDPSTVPLSPAIVTLNDSVTGLTPNAKHWLVADHFGITTPLNFDNSIDWIQSYSNQSGVGYEALNGFVRRAPNLGDWIDFGAFRGKPILVNQMRVVTRGEPSVQSIDVPLGNEIEIALVTNTRISAQFSPAVANAIHFDNLEVPGDTADGTFKPLPAPAPDHPQAMAQTFVATGENVSEITLGFGRFGTPGGKLIFSIREVDGATNEPGEEIGIIGELVINDVPQDENDVCSQPKKLPTVTVNGLVDGLIPGETYFLHIIESSKDKPTVTDFGTGPCGVLERGYSIDLVPNGAAEQIGEGGTHLLDWPYPPDGVLSGEWQQWPEPNRSHLSIRVRIAGTAAPEPTTDPFIIAETEDGSVTKVPDLDEYEVGSAVTVTATPEPGFEFIKWEYGDQEFATNPATITVTAGVTLTPHFEPVTPEPIDVEILPAMAIRWESEAGQTYEVQSSPDLEKWTTEAVGVEGTGEVMTHFFVREAREMYYRVLESE